MGRAGAGRAGFVSRGKQWGGRQWGGRAAAGQGVFQGDGSGAGWRQASRQGLLEFSRAQQWGGRAGSGRGHAGSISRERQWGRLVQIANAFDNCCTPLRAPVKLCLGMAGHQWNTSNEHISFVHLPAPQCFIKGSSEANQLQRALHSGDSLLSLQIT